MKAIKKIIGHLILGACIGITIGVISEMIFAEVYQSNVLVGTPEFVEQFKSINHAAVVARIAYAVVGGIGSLTSMIYNSDKIQSLLVKTVCSATITSVSLLCMAYLLKFFPFTLGSVVGFLLINWLIYACIWLGFYYQYRANIKRLNEYLHK